MIANRLESVGGMFSPSWAPRNTNNPLHCMPAAVIVTTAGLTVPIAFLGLDQARLLDRLVTIMSQPFDNRVVMITGACGGIGRELSFQMARLGAVIAAVDRDAEPLQQLAEKLQQQRLGVAWHVADVTDRDQLAAAVRDLEHRAGPISILVANAGIGLDTPAVGFPAEAFAQQIEVNLIGVANSIAAVLPGMLARRDGHLVAMSSLASYRGLPRMAGYCASKAGVNALMDSLRLELAGHGIRCTTICPGWIKTPLTENLDFPKPHILEVDQAVRIIADAIRRRRRFVAFPAPSRIPLEINRVLPTWLADAMARWYMRRMTARIASTTELQRIQPIKSQRTNPPFP